MTAQFPGEVYTPRTKENRSGVVYDAAQTKRIYAEDIQKLDAEIVAVETALGTEPAGAYETVKAWLTALTEAISGLVVSFLDLSDTPSSYTDMAGKVVAVNAEEDGLEFIDPPSGGGGSFMLFGAGSGMPTQNATYYLGLSGNGAGDSFRPTPTTDMIIPFDCTIDRLYVDLATLTIGGSGQTAVYTILKNGSDTALTCTLSSGQGSGSDLTHSVSFSAGDKICVKCVASATTGIKTAGIAVRVTPS
jgi:hypothetical protein